MYRMQKGCLSRLLASVGAAIFVCSIVSLIFAPYSTYVNYQNTLPREELMHEVIATFVASLIVFLFFLPFIIFISGLFPPIRLTKRGIKYRFLGYGGGEIKWSEIDDLIELKRPNNTWAIIILRNGCFLFNGLWSNTLYGIIFLGQPEPILIISEKTEEREKLLAEIREKSNLQNKNE